MSLTENLNFVQNRISSACERCGRDPEEIKLVWISKTRPREAIREAYNLGAFYFGENKVQETLEKYPLESANYELHFVGRLQSNKVRKIIPLCHTIQSVDSLKLLSRIDTICGQSSLKRDVFLQVNTSGESSKAGFSPEELIESLSIFPDLSNINIKGLMTIGLFSDDLEAVRPCFRRLNLLKEQICDYTGPQAKSFSKLKYLSMGMSSDFEVAIEEGSHYIRIGTDLFGTRMR